MAIAELPSWLAAEQRYEPAGARHRVMQKNVLHLASLLERVRWVERARGRSMIDRALSSVSRRAPGGDVRLRSVRVPDAEPAVPHVDDGYRAGARCRAPRTRAARDLCTGARRHGARGGSGTACPAAGCFRHGAMLKIALKTFINVSLVLGVSWTLTWSRMSAALKMLHLPDEVIFTFDMALKHIEVLGRTAHNLCESVMLRSVGRAPEGFSRTDSIAGIMGMTFIKAMECSRAMDEAMLCRGFAGAYPTPARSGFGWRDAVYAAGVALLAVLCAVL